MVALFHNRQLVRPEIISLDSRLPIKIHHCTDTFIGLQAIDCNLPAYFFLKAIVLFLCFMSALSYFNDNKNHICAIVRTLGTSTLFILCIHILIQTPFQRAIMKIFGHREVFTGYIDVALTLLVIYLLIPFVNKYLPWAIGKKRSG